MVSKKKFQVLHLNIKSEESPKKEPKLKIFYVKFKEPTEPKEMEITIPSSCDTVVPYHETISLPLEKAVDTALDHTKKTKKETAFLFDAESNRLITPIVSGCESMIGIDYSYIQDPKKISQKAKIGHFHSHPLSKSRKEKCFFSDYDLRSFALGMYQRAILGCVSSKQLDVLEFDFSEVSPEKMLQYSNELTAIEDRIGKSETDRSLHESEEELDDFVYNFKKWYGKSEINKK